MKPVVSAGLLMYKMNQGAPEVLLGHPGGPYYVDCDEGVWSIPKGQAEHGETLLETAIREFSEETGLRFPVCQLLSLGHTVDGEKQIYIWALPTTATKHCLEATCLYWSGRRNRGSCKSSRNLIGCSSLLCRRRDEKSSTRNACFLTNCSPIWRCLSAGRYQHKNTNRV